MLDLGGSELSVSLVRDDEIRDLNRRYRHKDRPTDVLAFALREGAFAAVGNALGDVVISLETARRQAREHGGALVDEVDRLLVHGILHLAGYDHEISPREERRMRRKEREVRARLRRASSR
jgi:rRNA maturation RNase YbeY